MKIKILTLIIIQKNGKVLLGMKKRGFGKDRLNGFGGKVEEGESIENAARREVKEEAGIDVKEIEKIGILDFEFQSKKGEILNVHIFKAIEFIGEPSESEEMKPAWFDENKIPFELMWPDDKFWMPLFLKNKKFKGNFLFGVGDSVIEYNLNEVENIS